MFADPITEITISASKELGNLVEKKLIDYRNVCVTDYEFSMRMDCHTFIDRPNIRQYTFDGLPAFYSEIKIADNVVTISVGSGEWKEKSILSESPQSDN